MISIIHKKQLLYMITLYGIKNCTTMAKASKWLTTNNVNYNFHDYKKHGITQDLITLFSKEFGWQKVINAKGTTYRKLPDNQKPTNEAEAITIALANPSILKRPIIFSSHHKILGFDETEYLKLLS
ncbi:MAG: Spx/MgsR family RNA polymerase-binding regulatory protein [Rickettsiales bacterium]|jgi:arsenate reductase